MREIIILFFIISCYSCQSENKSQTTKPKLSNVTESVYASISVRPEVSYFPQTNRTGIIQHISIKKGDQIKKGQVLFKILTSNANNRLIDAKLNLDLAKENYSGKNNLLANIKLELKMEQEVLSLDSINFKRQDRLWKQNIGTKVELDKAKIKYDATKNRYNALKKKYSQTNQNLETNYKKALNLVANERTSLNDFIVRSEIDGNVYDIFKEVGEGINPQEKFAEIGDSDNYKIDMDIDEVDITKIDLGDTAVISLEAYPEEVFMAKITKIYPKKNENTQTFKIESSFIKNPPKLYNGLSGEANIIVATRENVLTIPTGYLKYSNMVETVDGDKMIVTGIKNLDFVEVVSGIDTTTTLIKPSE